MKRYCTLPFVLFVAFGFTYFLPQQGALKPSAISEDLPLELFDWDGEMVHASAREKQTLAEDTRFRKMNYWRRGLPSQFEKGIFIRNNRVHLSVVFSGKDLNNSIHRPERCLPAQGHFNMVGSPRLLPVPQLGVLLPVQRLNSRQELKGLRGEGKTSGPVVDSLTYYFFVGHDKISNSHTQRTLFDMKDRLLRGYDQSWAYVSLSLIYGDHSDLGMIPLREDQADQILSEMVAQLAVEKIDWNLVPLSSLEKIK